MFTGDEFADGAHFIIKTLREERSIASFFLTGNFYKSFPGVVDSLAGNGHFLGNHSDRHLLYCDWTRRDSLLVDKKTFFQDLLALTSKLRSLEKKQRELGFPAKSVEYFLPPYEWYNDTISKWTAENEIHLINFTPGTLSYADYTTPDAKNYRSSDVIYNSITDYEKKSSSGLNGFILLMHIGTDPKRTDKFYSHLPQLIRWLKSKSYTLVDVHQLLGSQ